MIPTSFYDAILDVQSLSDVAFEADCGPSCSGFSFLRSDLPVIKYSTDGWRLTTGFIHSAPESFWEKHVQCLYTTDSNSIKRHCCTDAFVAWHRDGKGAVWDEHSCDNACNDGVTPRCKQAHAGCGEHASGGWDGEHCYSALWCSENGVKSADTWIDWFAWGDTGVRQCAWKPSEKNIWLEAMRKYYSASKKGDTDGNSMVCIENEVSVYMGEGDDGVQSALMDNLLGFFFDRHYGTEWEMQQLRAMQSKLASLGKSVPIIAVTPEHPKQLRWWPPEDDDFDAKGPPYYFAEACTEEEAQLGADSAGAACEVFRDD